jgi:3-phenylpropionate/trans-cinnamate dioxygenase ferredoxin reductase subunit
VGANRIAVVGGSLAGSRAAETIRRAGYEGRIALVGAEPERAYDRPPLSKKYLRGQHPEEKLYLRPVEHYDRMKIDLVLGAQAKRLDTTARSVELDDGRTIDFDHLVIATGADVRRLDCPGAGLEGVHYLRSLGDARALREEAKPGRRAVIVGAGVIGAEVAASLREEGLEVVVLELAELPLVRAFGPEVGRVYADVHRGRGVDLRCSTGVAELRGSKRVEEVVTTRGERIGCDFVVVGIGVSPCVGWLAGSGVAVEGGVLVDETCATNLPGIWAAGDVARFWDPRLKKRTWVESIDNAQNQAVVAANNTMGKGATYAPIPFFWSDQYDLKMQSVGYVEAYDRVVYRGSIDERAFAAFHLREGVLKFAIGVNRMKEIAGAKKLVAAGCSLDVEALADEGVALHTLLPAG